MEVVSIIADVLVILCAVVLLLGIPFIWVGVAKELKKGYVEELREEVETKRSAWKQLLTENEELKKENNAVKLYIADKIAKRLKDEYLPMVSRYFLEDDANQFELENELCDLTDEICKEIVDSE